MADEAPIGALIASLRAIVGHAHVLDADEAAQRGYLVDALGKPAGRPACVVEPATTLQVSQVIQCTHRLGVPVVPFGGNTGLSGGAFALPENRAVLVSLRRMNGIAPIDTASDFVVVEAGCVLAKLQEAASAADRLFPLSLTAEGSCQIGGNIATNAGGINAVRYGTMRDLVLGLEVVLPDGTVLDMMRSLHKDNAGYDLKHLFIGCGGTLGLITRAVLRLYPAVNRTATVLVGLADAQAALALFDDIQRNFGGRMTSCELIDRPSLDLVLQHDTAARAPFATTPEFTLLLELGTPDASQDLETELEDFLGLMLEENKCLDAVIARSGQQAAEFWHLRHALAHVLRHAGLRFAHDISVPIAAQAAFVDDIRNAFARFDPQAIVRIYGHVGDGNLHTLVCFPHVTAPDGALKQAADGLVDDLVLKFGGSITAEHGVGTTYRGRLVATRSANELSAMRMVKTAFDPRNLMNPGKIL